MTAAGANPLWQYSLRLYPQIEAWCLTQQDEHAVNVNLLLLCCYLGSRGQPLSAGQLDVLRDAIEPWEQQLVAPLRHLRRTLKTSELGVDMDSLRDRIKGVELDAERQVQDLLWARRPAATATLSPELATAANLRRCLAGREAPGDVIRLALSTTA